MNLEAAKRILGEAPDDLPEIHYFPRSGKYWIRNGRGRFVEYPYTHVKGRLSEVRLNSGEIS